MLDPFPVVANGAIQGSGKRDKNKGIFKRGSRRCCQSWSQREREGRDTIMVISKLSKAVFLSIASDIWLTRVSNVITLFTQKREHSNLQKKNILSAKRNILGCLLWWERGGCCFFQAFFISPLWSFFYKDQITPFGNMNVMKVKYCCITLVYSSERKDRVAFISDKHRQSKLASRSTRMWDGDYDVEEENWQSGKYCNHDRCRS